MSSDVFIISYTRDASAPTAIRQAVELAEISPARVQDVVFGSDSFFSLPDLESITRAAGLACASAAASSSLRALFFTAASLLSEDVELAVVAGLLPDACTAFVLASPEAVGRINLLPHARLAARSLFGPEPALRQAGLAMEEVQSHKAGASGALLLADLLDELDEQSTRWGMLSVGELVLLVERI